MVQHTVEILRQTEVADIAKKDRFEAIFVRHWVYMDSGGTEALVGSFSTFVMNQNLQYHHIQIMYIILLAHHPR